MIGTYPELLYWSKGNRFTEALTRAADETLGRVVADIDDMDGAIKGRESRQGGGEDGEGERRGAGAESSLGCGRGRRTLCWREAHCVASRNRGEGRWRGVSSKRKCPVHLCVESGLGGEGMEEGREEGSEQGSSRTRGGGEREEKDKV